MIVMQLKCNTLCFVGIIHLNIMLNGKLNKIPFLNVLFLYSTLQYIYFIASSSVYKRADFIYDRNLLKEISTSFNNYVQYKINLLLPCLDCRFIKTSFYSLGCNSVLFVNSIKMCVIYLNLGHAYFRSFGALHV